MRLPTNAPLRLHEPESPGLKIRRHKRPAAAAKVNAAAEEIAAPLAARRATLDRT